MSFDLRIHHWLTVRRRSGAVDTIAPFELTDRIAEDPIVALAVPRPDFQGAVLEFLIGLFSVALALREHEDWEELGERPPSPDALRAALLRLPRAFMLDGDGPRFLQDFTAADFTEQVPLPIENLLIDAAGENTQKLNKDLFVKRDRVPAMGLPAAAMALITLQTYAPSGGQGHRTSMRGGGPLTTLAEPRGDGRGQDASEERPLWELIHANLQLADGDWVLPAEWSSPQSQKVAERIWPWLAPTVTSAGKPPRQISPVWPDAHPFQALFGMPRRIRLDFDNEAGTCTLTGQQSALLVRSYRTRNFGVDYGDGLWRHPLSPHYRDKDRWRPVHPQPDGLGWKDWAGLVARSEDERAADCISRYGHRLSRPQAVRAFGYDMDNMKARGWAEALLPVWPQAGMASGVAEALAEAARQMVEATRLAGNLLVGAVIAARFKSDVKGDFSPIKASLWAAMEQDFFARLDAAVSSQLAAPQAILAHGGGYLADLRRTSCAIFDAEVDLDGLAFADAQQLVSARRNLVSALNGYGAGGNRLFAALGLPKPDKTPKKSREKAA
jgi:CRISPR system Cascade subunit CasA